MTESGTPRWHATVVVETVVSLPPDEGPGVMMDLALDPDVHASSQASARERVVARTGQGLLERDDTVTFRARHLGIWWTMSARVTELDRPARFVDEQVAGPFAAFRHTHRFEGRGNRTAMIDEFSFRLPGGAVGGVVARLVAVPYLRRLLTHRGAHLAAIAEGGHTT